MRERMDNTLIVTNIQRMCFHDGPGIRTTVFLKGCNLHCPWCSNPENIHFQVEEYEKDGKKGIYGKAYTSRELIKELLKDINFWSSGGGVTFSGGEALMQIDALEDVVKLLKEWSIHIAIETALFISARFLERVIPYIDYFIVDIKILDEKLCKTVLGGELLDYKKNVEILYKSGKLKLFRVPCCKEYTFTEKNKELLLAFLEKYSDIPVELFTIHELGESKYKSLNIEMWKGGNIAESELEEFQELLLLKGINTQIIQI